jgi:hypothetical protein
MFSFDDLKRILRYDENITKQKKLPYKFRPPRDMWDSKPDSEYIINNYYISKFKPPGSDNYVEGKLSITHIYDGYLSSAYGGNIHMVNKCLQIFNKKFDLELLVEIPLGEELDGISSFLFLYAFLLDKTKKYTYVYFGPPKHATALYFNRTNKFIKITYINTGEGSRDDIKVNDENETYYQIFNSIYLPDNDDIIDAFMHYIKPFLLYRYIEIDEKSAYDIIIKLSYINFHRVHLEVDKDGNDNFNIINQPKHFNLFNKKYDGDINDFYNNIYNDLFKKRNRNIYYELIVKLFDIETQEGINKLFPKLAGDIIEHTKVMNAVYEKFSNDWNMMVPLEMNKMEPTDMEAENYSSWDDYGLKRSNYHFYVNYRKFALNNFIQKLAINGDNKMIFFAFQKSGTCVFKSCMATIFLHIITNHPDEHFPTYYLEFTEKMFGYLNENIETYKQNIVDNLPDNMIIYNKLVSDNIIDIKYKPFNLIYTQNLFNIEEAGITRNVVELKCGPNINDFNDIIKRIRNKDRSVFEKIKQSYDITNFDKDAYQAEKEFILVSILWEYYFNFEKWEAFGIFNDYEHLIVTSAIIFKIYENLTVRTMLNIDELMWIYKIHLAYCYQNEKDPQFIYNKMWKEFDLLRLRNLNYDSRESSRSIGRVDGQEEIDFLLYSIGFKHLRFDLTDKVIIDKISIVPDDIAIDIRSIMNYNESSILSGDFQDNLLSFFIINNLIFKINASNDNFDSQITNYKNIEVLHINDMYNMLPHILNVFTRNAESYTESSYVNIYVYIKTFLMFYQYFNINIRFKIIKSIIKQFNHIIKTDINTFKNLSVDINSIDYNSEEGREKLTNIQFVNVLFDKISNLLNTLTSNYHFLETTGYDVNRKYNDFTNGNITVEKVRLDINYNTINQLTEILNGVDDDSQIDDLMKTLISKLKFSLTHKDISINGNYIEYTYNNKKFKSTFIAGVSYYNCPLISYFNTEDINSTKIFYNRKDGHVLMLVNKYNYNYPFEDNILFIFETETINYETRIKFNNIMINGKLYDYTEDYKKYPFLINLPLNCLNFVSVIQGDELYYNNTYKVLSFYNENYNIHFLSKSVNANHPLKPPPPEYGEFIIKSNMLTPVYDDLNKAYLQNIRALKKGEYIYTNIEPNDIDIYMCEDMIEYKPVTFNKLDELLKRGKDAVDNIYESIIKNVKEERREFVDMLSPANSFISKFKEIDKDGNEIEEYDEAGNKFTFENCRTSCDNKPSPEIRRNIINGLLLLRNKIIKEIVYVDININSVMQFMKHNNHILSLLLQVNNIIDNMIRLNKAVDKCYELTCHDIYELNEIFNIRGDNMDTFEMIIEIVFGRVLRQEQLDRYYDMMKDYKNGVRSVFQFMMGKGKSSIVTPMLYYNLTRLGEKVYIVVPTHLVKQTIATYYSFHKYLNNIPEVMTDNDLKLKFLEGTYDKEAIYLFDEFDSMYNPLQSNFNIIRKMMKSLKKEEIDYIFMIAYDYMANNIKPPIIKYSREDDIISILTNDAFVKNVSYGMSSANKKSRICIPYSRQDSPAEGSSFSSYMITLLLTIKYFYNNKNFKIYNEDLEYMINNNKKLLTDFIDFFYEGKEYPFTPTNTLHEKIALMKQNYTEYILPVEWFIKYLYTFANEIKRTEEIMNCSFIDIMQMPCVWQVGYSGTVKMDMNIPPIPDNKLQHYNTIISEDRDEYTNVFTALHRYRDIILLKPFKNDINNVLNKIFENNIDVIIDACALFKDYPNNIIAKMIYDKKQRQVIFLTKDDDMMLYTERGVSKFSYGALNNPIYYFSQRHTVGIDIMNQPTSLKGIVLLDDSNTYTQISQAIYRMRKLNKGQTIMIGYLGNNSYTKSKEVYKMINDNDNAYQNGYKPLLYLQYLKYYYRSSIKNDKNEQYIEKDLGLIYDAVKPDELRNLNLIINRRLLRNIFSINSHNLRDIDKFRKIVPLDKCVDYILAQTPEKLLELLYNVNTFTINRNIDIQEDIEEDKESQRLRILMKNTQLFINRLIELPTSCIMYNPFKTLPEYKRLYSNILMPIQNGKYTIYIPYNNVKASINSGYDDYISKFFIVMIDELNYIIEPSKMINKYINMVPIYTLKGEIINDISFPGIKRHIDINNIFNFTISTDDAKYNDPTYVNDFAVLFDIIEGPINNIKVDKGSFIIYSLIHLFMQFSLTESRNVRDHIVRISERIAIEFLLNNDGKTFDKMKQSYADYIKPYYDSLELVKPLDAPRPFPKNRGAVTRYLNMTEGFYFYNQRFGIMNNILYNIFKISTR